jgi:hypothetical protein
MANRPNIDLAALKERLANARKEYQNGRRTITIQIETLEELVKELEELRTMLSNLGY